MGIYAIKPKFQSFLSPITNWLIKNKISPTTLNFFGLVLSILAGLCIYYSNLEPLFLLLIPLLVFIRTAVNALDGLVSRALGLASAFGEVLNEFLDRISDVFIFFSIALLEENLLVIGSVAVIVILLNSYLSIVSKAAGGKRQYGGIMGKADRMIYLGLFALVVFLTKNSELWKYFLWFILVGTVITLIQRFLTTKRELDHA